MVARWHSQDLANCITVLSAPFLPPKEFASISRHLKFLVSVHAGREYALNVVPLHLDGHRSWKSLFPQFRLPEPLEQTMRGGFRRNLGARTVRRARQLRDKENRSHSRSNRSANMPRIPVLQKRKRMHRAGRHGVAWRTWLSSRRRRLVRCKQCLSWLPIRVPPRNLFPR